MQLTLRLDITPPPRQISYTDNILLVGSCFSENMAERLSQFKFSYLSNPHGILFNPLSVCSAIETYLSAKTYKADELFYLNELWNSWDHHTKFSHIDKDAALNGINSSQQNAADFIKKADHVIITLGSAFQYYLAESGHPVSNNHRAPGQWFEKRLLTIDIISDALSRLVEKVTVNNPHVQVIFTISPVRHIRDGVVDNNRSKARLIEAVHQTCGIFSNCYYFPAYELMIDILRDYRYYDIDFVHPNYLGTSFIWEQFSNSCILEDTRQIMKEIGEITTAYSHKPRFPETEAHRAFKEKYHNKITELAAKYPFLNLKKELEYFSK